MRQHRLPVLYRVSHDGDSGAGAAATAASTPAVTDPAGWLLV